MVGRNFTDEGLVSMHWSNPAGPDVLVEIRRTNTARDVREGLLALAYAVQSTSRPSTGVCVSALDTRMFTNWITSEASAVTTGPVSGSVSVTMRAGCTA